MISDLNSSLEKLRSRFVQTSFKGKPAAKLASGLSSFTTSDEFASPCSLDPSINTMETITKSQSHYQNKELKPELFTKRTLSWIVGKTNKQETRIIEKNIYQDRFIPSRKHSNLAIALTSAHNENICQDENQVITNQNNLQSCPVIQAINQKDLGSQLVNISDLFKTEILGIKPPKTKLSKYETIFSNRNILAFSGQRSQKCSSSSLFQGIEGNGLLCASDQNEEASRNMIARIDPFRLCKQNAPFSLNPDIKAYFYRTSRKISKIPFKVLDAPTLKDDFYLNLVDWGENNQIAVGLGSCVYLWSAATSKVTKLCDIRTNGEDSTSSDDIDNVTSVSWGNQGTHLAIGTNSGSVSVWDIGELKKIKEYNNHRQRVGALAWNKDLLVSGSRDKKILVRDTRASTPVIYKLLSHKQEVCGLKWSYDNQMLASGGNDNNLFVWNLHSSTPIIKLTSHTAAVKAISWSPHQHGLLISGGGSLDRTIRIWNTVQREQVRCIDTGSQVCNLQFCKNRNEFVSTHGYSENQVIVWNYPDLEKLAVLTGHTQRVLHLAMSPDGDTIATGAGDETLRFWNISDGIAKLEGQNVSQSKSQLLPSKNYLR